MVLSALELLELTATPIGVSSVDELLALPYDTAPFSQGMTADDFRALHVEHGERIRWWKAIRATPGDPRAERDGFVYEEQALDSGVRALFHDTLLTVESAEFGLIQTGQTSISVLPDEIELARGDRLLRLDKPESLKDALVTRGGGDFDELPERFIYELRVYVDGVLRGAMDTAPDTGKVLNFAVNADGQACFVSSEPEPSFVQTGNALNFAVNADGELCFVLSPGILSFVQTEDGRGGLRWLANAPAEGTVYSCEYRFAPLYRVSGEGVRSGPIGADGLRLPQRAPLMKEIF